MEDKNRPDMLIDEEFDDTHGCPDFSNSSEGW
jgi:hypothetical protein